MLIIKIDPFDAETFQTRVAGRAHIVRAPINSEKGAVRRAHIPKFRGEKNLVTALRDRAADELFVLADAIHVGRVEEGDAAIERVVDRRNRLGLVATGVEVRHAHAAKPDR